MTRWPRFARYLLCLALPSCGPPHEAPPATVTLPIPSTTSNPEQQPTVAKAAAPSNAPDSSVDDPPSVHGMVTLVLVTAGARVQLVSGKDRRAVSIFPIRIRIDTSQSWTIEATKHGYRPYRQPIDFSDGVLEKTFNIELTQ